LVLPKETQMYVATKKKNSKKKEPNCNERHKKKNGDLHKG